MPDNPHTQASQPALTIDARGLTRRFGIHVAVQDIDLELHRGEVLGFLGPNGAGKTTTMQMLTGNLAPTAGAVRICGIDLMDKPVAAKARLGYLPETPPLYRELTVDEYLRLAAKLHRVPSGALSNAIEKTKSRCGLADTGRKLIANLSKGYQQRVGIAQAIVHDPDVVILDEPTVGLDPNQIREIRDLIRELGGEHSVVLCTHILPEVEAVCDRVQILHHGKVVYNDTIAALKAFHSGRTLVVGLRNPPSIEELAAIEGVTAAEAIDATLFRITTSLESDPTSRVVETSVRSGWDLYQLAPAQRTLEDVFVQLTRQEPAPQAT